MPKTLLENAKKLPVSPGVYFFIDNKKKIIYVGKALNLKNRVSSYFQNQKNRDIKTKKLVESTEKIDYLVAESEIQALFLESEFIKRYKPIFNVQSKDDKNFIYLRISDDKFPIVSYVRRVGDDKAKYFGPFMSAQALRRSMRYLRRIFPFVTTKSWPKVSPLEYQLGLVPPPDIDQEIYKRNIQRLIMILHGKTKKLIVDLTTDMKKLAKAKDFEKAAKIRDLINAILSLKQKVIFSDKSNYDIQLDRALSGLRTVLNLSKVPVRIEAYDISNFAGSESVGSMIVFKDGLPQNSQYRRFRLHSRGPDDFAMIREIITRRFSKHLAWPLPDLIVVDGGKGQLSSAEGALKGLGVCISTIGLAKRYEQIVRLKNENFEIINLPKSSATLKLLQRIRDEAHRFAITYHRNLKSKKGRYSRLKQIQGIGDATYAKLIRAFGSMKKISQANEKELIEVVGKSKANLIKEGLAYLNK